MRSSSIKTPRKVELKLSDLTPRSNKTTERSRPRPLQTPKSSSRAQVSTPRRVQITIKDLKRKEKGILERLEELDRTNDFLEPETDFVIPSIREFYSKSPRKNNKFFDLSPIACSGSTCEALSSLEENTNDRLENKLRALYGNPHLKLVKANDIKLPKSVAVFEGNDLMVFDVKLKRTNVNG